VDELDRDPSEQILPRGRALATGGGGQGESGPEPLSPCREQVGRDLVEEGVAGDHRFDEQGFEPLQLIFECGKPEELEDVHFLQTIGEDADAWEKPLKEGGVRVRVTGSPVDFALSQRPRMEAVECLSALQTELVESWCLPRKRRVC
jgi:hypothetical protein